MQLILTVHSLTQRDNQDSMSTLGERMSELESVLEEIVCSV